MTRVCVTWDREETSRLIARCREAIEASDETAKGPLFPARTFAGTPIGGPDEERLTLNGALRIVLDGIAATLVSRGQSRLHHVAQAQASLAAIAAALGQEEGS